MFAIGYEIYNRPIVTPVWEPEDLPHYEACENREGYMCKRCNLYIEPGQQSKNWCDYCGQFASKVETCICETLEEIWGGR